MGTHLSNSYERAFAVRNCCICSFDICSLLEIRSFDLNRLCTHIISYFVWNGSSFSSHCAYLVFVLFWNYRSHLLDSIFRFWWAFTIVWFIHNTHLVYVTYYVRMYFIRFTITFCTIQKYFIFMSKIESIGVEGKLLHHLLLLSLPHTHSLSLLFAVNWMWWMTNGFCQKCTKSRIK